MSASPGREALARAWGLRFGDPPRCLAAAEEAQGLLESEGDATGALEAELLQAASRGRLGDRHRALVELASVRDRYGELGDSVGQAVSDLASGTNYLRLGEPEAALELLSHAEEVLRTAEHDELGACLSALALTQAESGDEQAALQTLTSALELDGVPVGVQVALLVNRGEVSSRVGQVDEAQADLAAMEPLIAQMPDPPEAPIYRWISIEQEVIRLRCMLARGQMEQVRQHAEQLLEGSALASVSARGEVMLMLARAWRARPDPDQRRALGLLERGLVWARKEDNDALQRDLLAELAELRRDLGDLEGALAARDMLDMVRERIHRQTLRDRLANMRTRLEIEALRRERERLSAANEALERLSRDQQGLIEVLGHDLRSPLGTIMASAELLSDSQVVADRIERTGEVILEAGRRMVHLLDALTSEGARSTGKWTLRSEEVDVAEELGALLANWRERARSKSIELSEQLESGCRLQVDRLALVQVVDNLVSNAVKFTPLGGKVRVGSTLDDGTLVLVVEDSGPGLTSEEQEVVFQRFVRGSARPTAGESSTGLGLSLVAHLVEQLGGRLEVGRSEWGGARVSVILSR